MFAVGGIEDEESVQLQQLRQSLPHIVTIFDDQNRPATRRESARGKRRRRW